MSYIIFGSCVTRDVFRVVGQDAAIKQYIARMSVISATSPPLAQQVEINLTSAFQRRQVQNDLYKDLLPCLQEPGHTVVIDLIEERFALLQVGKAFLTRSNEFVHSSVEEQLTGAHKVDALSEESKHLFLERASKFRDLLHPATKVILQTVYWSEEYLSGDERHTFTDRLPYIRRNNEHLAFCQEALTQALSPIVITPDPQLRLATDAHTWGLTPYHFTDEYYWEVWRQIEAVV